MLDAFGLLPPGRHRVTVDQFQQHFVDAFPQSVTRKRLFLRWSRHRQALSSVLTIQSQWINGSYVTNKSDPEDVDVVTLFDAEEFENLAPGLQAMAEGMLAGKQTKAVWGIDCYALPVFPDGHTLASNTRKTMSHWDWFWSRIRDDDDGVKGYLEVSG